MVTHTIQSLENLKEFIEAKHLNPFENEKLIELGKLCKFNNESIEVDVLENRIVKFTYIRK
jgi:hypothetical protein